MTISGLVDIGYGQVNAPANVLGNQTGDISRVAQNGSATTTINIAGTEDLGGGMKANFRYEINPDFVNGSGVTGGAGAESGSTGAIALGNGGMHQAFLGLEGGFGQVKLGRVNTGTLSAWGTGSVFGTALGSGYGSNGNIFTRYSASTGNYWNVAPTRFNGSVEYTTPVINGFTARALYVPQVNKTGIGAENACAQTACTTDTAVAAGANRAGVTDFSLAYNNGPLNAIVAQQSVKIGGGDINALVSPTLQSTANSSRKQTTAAANYTMGAATVYGAYWTEKQTAATAVDVQGYMLGAKYVTGAYALMASMGNSNDKTSANVDKKIFGLGVDYALSKRSTVYARYESRDADKNVATDAAASGVTKTTHVGVRHTF